MIRHCPNCETERPLTELFCEGVIDGHNCGWDLSTVDITERGAPRPPPPAPAPPPEPLTCRNGHPIFPGDIICGTCGEPIDLPDVQPPPPEPQPPAPETIIEGWRLLDRVPSSSLVRERFASIRDADNQRGVLTLYAPGSEPDQAVYDVLQRLPRDHVPEIFVHGRWSDRAYEVCEEFTGGSLADFAVDPADQSAIRSVIRELANSLHALAETGLRHRDLRPSVIFVRSRDPLDLVIGGFGSARLSEFDLDIASPLETTRYMAPEAIAGGVAPASDWWSLGMIVLEKITKGACFEGVNEHAFLIHVLTSGVPLPDDLDPALNLLLRGLLARDRRRRWQWKEVQAWLAGEPVSAPDMETSGDTEGRTSISLGGRQYRAPHAFAFAAAEAKNWDEARNLAVRGAIATWASDAGFDPKIAAALRQLLKTENLSDDLKLSVSLKTLNPAMPLIVRGNIVTPGWLLDHPADGYALITGPVPDLLHRIDPEDSLWRLKARAETVHKRLDQLEIAVDEETLRVHLLSTSTARTAALWEEKRKLFPDTDHAGLTSLIERRQTAEEDLLILLAASSSQFRPAAEVIEEAAKESSGSGIKFSPEDAAVHLERPRREIYQTIDARIENFARCGIAVVDEWADQFRLDRRMPLGRALAVLSVPAHLWQPLPKQSYVSRILEFFAKRISGGVLRGPLTRMLIGKSARIDLMELNSSRHPAAEILDDLIARTGRHVNIDPAAFSENDGLERRLRSLHSHALLYKRDTGIDGLYMGFPFLLMRDGRTNTKPRIAPVLLWPVRVVPEVGNRGHITLGYGREKSSEVDAERVILNPALDGIVGIEQAKQWEDAAKDLLTRATLSVQDVMDAFSSLATPAGDELTALPGKEVKVAGHERRLVPSAVLFHLAFMGQAVMTDLDFLRKLPPKGTALEAALRLNEQDHAADTATSQPVRELDRYFTADSDPSQEDAVIEARQTPGLVVEGPPGTGKSQTIVNMVSDAIGTGKSLLIICQKQAALEVVRKRLDKERLTDRFVMITDVNRDREAIISSIRSQVEALHLRPSGTVPTWKRDRERLAVRIETLETELDRRQAALHAADERTGLSYRALLAELLAIEAKHPKPIEAPSLRPLLAELHPADVASIEESCGPLAKHWLPSKFEGSPLSVLKPFNPDRGTVEAFTGALRAFAETDTRREQTDAETSDCLTAPDPAALRTWLLTADKLRSVGALATYLGYWLPLFRRSEGETSVGVRIIRELQEMNDELTSLDTTAYIKDFSSRLIAVDQSELRTMVTLGARFTKPPTLLGRFNPRRWSGKRRLARTLLSLQLPQKDDAITALFRAAKLELALRAPRARLGEHFTTLFARSPDAGLSPTKLSELATHLHSLLSNVHELVVIVDACPDRAALDRAVLTQKSEELDKFFVRADLTLRRHDGREQSRAALARLNSYFDELWLGSRRSTIESGRSNASALAQIVDALPMLSSYQEYRLRSARSGQTERAIFALLRAKEADLLTRAPADLDATIRATIGREARLAWQTAQESANPDVLFDSEEVEGKIVALAEADRQIRNSNRELLVHGIEAARVGTAARWSEITRLRGPRALRLREFIERGVPLGLFAIRPVWLMTPDVASRVLQPRAAFFDTVIFDEASQMPVEYALPSLFRSKLVIVSGDEKQMPPTSFFASKVENDEAAIFDGDEPEEGATDEEREVFAETWNRREIKDCPDLLQLARAVLPKRTLQVHYRSKYRELISFSNASFYANGLSVPVRHPEETIQKVKPIQVIRSDGVYKTQTNEKEAADVVEYLSKLWHKKAPPSVGVVTFNRKQADVIEDALEEKAETNRAFRDALIRERERVEDGEDMGFFVKNVENVQGDERDIIVFSTTFGRNEQGTFRKNFGALGHVGGERRLNVAVTRAREKVVIVTSMPVSEISDLLTRRSGPRVPRDYLQGYLEYARMVSDGLSESGGTLLQRLVTEKQAGADYHHHEEDGFTRSVEDFLETQGWKPTRARDSGAFSLDFAIKSPHTGLYAIGVECDAPRHRLLEKARAREIWRPKVLSKAVPHVHRVSSYAWTHSGEAERSRLRSAVENALRS